MTSHLLEAAAPVGPTTTHRGRRRARTAAILAVTALSAAACSTSSSSTVALPNAATAQADVQAVYNTLFNLSDKSIPPKLAAIQDGQSLEAATTQAISSSLATSATGATVNSVTILTASQCSAAKVPYPCAKVNYSILGANSQVLLGNSTGYAVYINGHWLVAKATICGLFSLFYSAEGNTGSVPGCAS